MMHGEISHHPRCHHLWSSLLVELIPSWISFEFLISPSLLLSVRPVHPSSSLQIVCFYPSGERWEGREWIEKVGKMGRGSLPCLRNIVNPRDHEGRVIYFSLHLSLVESAFFMRRFSWGAFLSSCVSHKLSLFSFHSIPVTLSFLTLLVRVKRRELHLLTMTCESVSIITRKTGAVEAAHCVGTVSEDVAWSVFALIFVCCVVWQFVFHPTTVPTTVPTSVPTRTIPRCHEFVCSFDRECKVARVKVDFQMGEKDEKGREWKSS